MDHPKLHALAEEIEHRGAPNEWGLAIGTGLFERLLLFTGQFAPDGSLGSFSSRQIARAVGWPLEPEWLVEAFVAVRLVDRTEQGLLVHDWHQHADRHVHRKLVRANRLFANGTAPNVSYSTENERRAWKGGKPAGLPGEQTSQQPGGVDSQSQSRREEELTVAAPRQPRVGPDGADARFEEFWAAYPKRDGDNPKRRAKNAWNARLAAGTTADEMIAGAKRYAVYVQARGIAGTQFVKQAATFLGPDCAFRESWRTNGVGERYVPNHPLYRKPGEFVG
jgi:hypothetical protein